MLVGQLHMIKIKESDIFILSTSCNLQMFSLSSKTLYVNINILDFLTSNIKLDPATKVVNKVIEYIEIG